MLGRNRRHSAAERCRRSLGGKHLHRACFLLALEMHPASGFGIKGQGMLRTELFTHTHKERENNDQTSMSTTQEKPGRIRSTLTGRVGQNRGAVLGDPKIYSSVFASSFCETTVSNSANHHCYHNIPNHQILSPVTARGSAWST